MAWILKIKKNSINILRVCYSGFTSPGALTPKYVKARLNKDVRNIKELYDKKKVNLENYTIGYLKSWGKKVSPIVNSTIISYK